MADGLCARLRLPAPVASRANAWVGRGVAVHCAVLEAVHWADTDDVHVTTLVKACGVRVVDFCKELHAFVDEFESELSKTFVDAARRFLVRTVQLWVLYCKYQSLFAMTFSSPYSQRTATLFACGWLLFLAIRAELFRTETPAGDDLYRLYTLLSCVFATVSSLTGPDAADQSTSSSGAASVPAADDVSAISASLYDMVVTRLSEQGVWHADNVKKSAIDLGRYIDRLMCSSSDEIAETSCWLLDGRICFSPSTVESVGNDLTIELSPILRSPGRPAPKTPVTRMMLSVAWLMRIGDAPALIESVQEAHRRVAFTYGSYDPAVVSYRRRIAFRVYQYLLNRIVGIELNRMSPGCLESADFSSWLNSMSFHSTLMFCAVAIVIGAYKIVTEPLDSLMEQFDVRPLELISVMRDIVVVPERVGPVIDDVNVHAHMMLLFRFCVVRSAWRDSAVKDPVNDADVDHVSALVRQLHRAGHQIVLDLLQRLSRSKVLVLTPPMRSCVIDVMDYVMKYLPESLLRNFDLYSVTVCAVYAVCKLSPRRDGDCVQLMTLYRAARDLMRPNFGAVQNLIAFYNERFIPSLKTFLFSTTRPSLSSAPADAVASSSETEPEMVLQMPLGDERLMADDTWDRLRCGMQELM
ncbi:unnamed protein product (mitochondrion) [Plasmodiophora brassicae]|uniref:Retinoblastoma-associated protein A-box domain-containing protein n=1 Tax=Plasmodiophora brassicae TaxID=37360 RepID=A0A3P3Y7G2_PLABS|nr:unnamed protein product [Plasmodiophora brassicae]